LNSTGEIGLRSAGLCNLSEVVVRSDDTYETLANKVAIATIIGTFQSMLTEFRYVRKVWQNNAEDERLLGVSLTGILDKPNIPESDLEKLQALAIHINSYYADLLGINASAAITTVKPSGTVSQLVDSASGIHPRHSPYYIRTVRNDIKDPITQFLIDSGVPHEIDKFNPNAYVFSFPIKSPDGATLRQDLSALDHLNAYMKYKKYWAEHNVSITVSVKEDEWLDVGAWVYKNFDEVCGVSFLPYSDHIYPQAPYQEITVDEYNTLRDSFPTLDWSLLRNYEGNTDNTTGSQEYACVGLSCEII
jgi:ribonucleoside-triphosphate reductase (thioredoxin)